MKRALLLILMLISVSVFAKKYHGELKTGACFYTAPSLMDQFGSTINGLEPSEIVDTDFNYPVFTEYSSYVSKKLRVSLHVDYVKCKENYYAPRTDRFIGTVTNRYYTSMIGVNFYYVKKKKFEMYYGGYLGTTYVDASNDIPNLSCSDGFRLAYHVNVVGARFGGRTGVAVELGFGYRGIVNVGLSYRI